jgi:hypothetical protein
LKSASGSGYTAFLVLGLSSLGAFCPSTKGAPGKGANDYVLFGSQGSNQLDKDIVSKSVDRGIRDSAYTRGITFSNPAR